MATISKNYWHLVAIRVNFIHPDMITVQCFYDGVKDQTREFGDIDSAMAFTAKYAKDIIQAATESEDNEQSSQTG